MSRLTIGIIAGAAAVLVVAAAGIAYLTQPHQAAPRFTISASPAPASSASPGAMAGTWVVDAGSQAGYRVKERFVDQPADTEAVARTSVVTGKLVMTGDSGLQLESATFSADISQIHSTDANATRGNAVRDRFVALNFLQTFIYPQATFVARPLSIPAGQAPADLAVPGSFTVHGVTHDVTIPLKVSQNGDRLEVVGSFVIHYQDYRIDVPSVPFTTAAPDATVEIHLFLKRSG
ncbi:MAG: YceI family protein [Candidatus Dormibacteria bacterium]